MIPDNISRSHILKAIDVVDREGVPPRRKSRKFDLLYEGRKYPPKYLVSLANIFVAGEELSPEAFHIYDACRFLVPLGFDILKEGSPVDLKRDCR